MCELCIKYREREKKLDLSITCSHVKLQLSAEKERVMLLEFSVSEEAISSIRFSKCYGLRLEKWVCSTINS